MKKTQLVKKRISAKKLIIEVSAITIALAMTSYAIGKNYIYTPDERSVAIKGGFVQPDISEYRSPLDSKIIDRTFYTNEATFMANEGFKTGMEGYNDMVKAGFPVAYKRAFQWVTAREMYFYARYLLDYIGGRSHSGVHMVHGPYWSMKAEKHSNFNSLVRDRGERSFSNKDILLGVDLPLVYQRTGFPRVFDDIQLTYLQYESVQPFFTGQLDNTDSFEDPMTGKKGGWGVANTYLNNEAHRFDQDKMNTTFDMGALGQFVKRRAQWADRFYQANHEGESYVSKGKSVSLVGNDAEEGLRGWGLAVSAFNEILQIKASMFTDGESLMGINTDNYDPSKGLRYLPHKIKPNLVWIGDIPERVWSIDIEDESSQLWDQASWIWATSAFAVTADRRNNLFTDNPPVDGGLLEKRMGLVSESLGNAIFKNIVAMHTEGGLLVSKWHPETGIGSQISLKDMAMAMVALRDLEESWEGIGRHQETAKKARMILKSNADFLVNIQNDNGSFNSEYKLNGQAIGQADVATANWEAIRALLSAYHSLEDKQYLASARAAYNLMNEKYWVAEHGVYKSALNDDIVTVTPYSVGITMAAMREVMFTTPTYLLENQIEKMTRWWIQTVDQSGLLLSEHQATGEVYSGYGTGDDDADGIPYVSKAHGKYGAAPVIAGMVKINIANKPNKAFTDTEGDVHQQSFITNVKNNYKADQHPSLSTTTALSLHDDKMNGLVKRNALTRTDGTKITLPASKAIKVGLGTKLNLTGKQIFEANCMLCHGEHGEGIDGKPLKTFMNYPAVAMEAFVANGNHGASMPPWGVGNGDKVGGPLTKDEIKRIVGYVQSDEFKDNYARTQNGEVLKNAKAKDIWFYLSRENLKNKGKVLIGDTQAKHYIKQMADPSKIEAGRYENIRVMPNK